MGGVLTVRNNRSPDFEILQANIFTPGQGICLQRLVPGKSSIFKFDHSLAYGSWYDIQIIVLSQHNGVIKPIRYLKKGVYLSRGKTIKMTKLTHERHCDYGIEWKCSTCRQGNFGSVAICEYCFTNKSQTIITSLSFIPLIGIPFSLADAILRCGKASQSNTRADKIDAGVTVTFAVLDVITAPFIVGSLVKIPAKVATNTGIKLTAKTVFCEAGKPLLKEFGKELGEGGIISGITLAKGTVKTVIRKTE